ncbi:MAG: cytochrome c3 family protein [Desulfobacteria bacterium]
MAGLRLPDAAAREQALGDLFTTLGHLTHLVSDISVPEHSRNDAHLLRNYESWCVENLTVLDNMIHGIQVFQPAFEPDDAIFAQNRAVRVSDSAPYSPVSNLWDSRVDPGYNARLGDSPNAPRLYGLADYSNFNYLSNNTVFKDYAHPSREEVGLRLIPRTAPDGQTDYVLYFNRNTSDGVPVQHLAATDLVFLDSQAPLDNSLRYVAAHLDDYCYEEYASNLVPRAVSYGTALVDYFFRGKFDVSGSGSTLTVTNRSSGTAAGTFAVYRDDPSDGLRKPVPGLENLAAAGLGSGSSTTYTAVGFSPPSSTDNLLLVFTGTIANEGAAPNEDNAVAGKAFSWASPQATYPVAWRPAPPTFSLPAGPRSHADYWPPGCYDCHYFLSPLPHYLRKDMTNLELCKSCHGMTAAANASLWDDARNGWPPPRTLVAPEGAPPEWKVPG